MVLLLMLLLTIFGVGVVAVDWTLCLFWYFYKSVGFEFYLILGFAFFAFGSIVWEVVYEGVVFF